MQYERSQRFATRRLALVCATAFLTLACGAAERDPLQADPAVVKAWRAMRFGMFIHWGPVALTGHEIGWSRGRETPSAEYDQLYRRFNPVRFDADAWVRTAQDAGMKYIVLTTKHHDGFCLWDTKQTDYNIMHSPWGRDVVKELAAACRKAGIAFGTYYSVCDWHHPDFPRTSPGGRVRREHADLDRYTAYLKAQVRELIANYGPLLTLWYDVPQEFDAERGRDLIAFTRALQPDILINNRTGAGGDYDTPEQRVGTFQADRPWETCMTICRQWAWKPNDRMKSLVACLQTLVRTAGGDGNLLFNVGPMPDGRIEPRQVERLREMGAWLQRYGQTIYGTRGGPFYPDRWGASTHRGSTVYLHVFAWEGNARLVPGLQQRILRATSLTGGSVRYEQNEESIRFTLPVSDQDPVDTIIRLDMDGPVTEMARQKHLPTAFERGDYGHWLSREATYTMSSRAPAWSTHEAALLNGADYHGGFAFHTERQIRPHIIIDLGRAVDVKGLEIENRSDGDQERARSLAVWLSTDRVSWQRVWQADAASADWAVVVTRSVAGVRQPGVRARYVKLGLEQDAPEYLHLKRVKVYGD